MEPVDAIILNTAAAQTLFGALAHQAREVVAFAYVAGDWRLLGLRHIAGRMAWVAPSFRAIVRDALLFDAAGVVVAHNHPSGDLRASRDDVAFATSLARTLAAIDVALIDQLVVTCNGFSSLRMRRWCKASTSYGGIGTMTTADHPGTSPLGRDRLVVPDPH